MLQTKMFELRDKHTFIPIIAVKLSAPYDTPEHYLLSRVGYRMQSNSIMLVVAAGGRIAESYSYAWDDRTFQTAHAYIYVNFDHLNSGSVIDVEWILQETTVPKLSERFEL